MIDKQVLNRKRRVGLVKVLLFLTIYGGTGVWAQQAMVQPPNTNPRSRGLSEQMQKQNISQEERLHEKLSGSDVNRNDEAVSISSSEPRNATAHQSKREPLPKTPILKDADREFLAQSFLASVAILAIAAWVRPDEAAVWSKLLKDFKSASISALVIHAISSLYQIITRLPEYWPVIVTAMTQPSVLTYLWETVLPNAIVAARTMVSNELWNRFFTRLFGIMGTLILHALSNVTGTNVPILFPAKNSSFWAAALQRGTKRLFQDPLKRHLQSALSTIWNYVVNAIRSSLVEWWGTFGHEKLVP